MYRCVSVVVDCIVSAVAELHYWEIKCMSHLGGTRLLWSFLGVARHRLSV